MNKVVVLGASVVDVLMKSKELKVLKSHQVEGGVAIAQVMGGKIEADEHAICSGGGGSNVAVGLKKMGEAVKLVSRVGSDELGKVLLKELESYDLDLSMMQKGSGQTGVSSVLINKDGGRAIVTHRGESLKIKSAEIDWETLKKANWVQVSSLGGRMDLLEDVVSYAQANGVKVGINPGKAELLSANLIPLLSKVDFLSLNRSEAAQLSGIDFKEEEEILKSISSMGAMLLMVTDGKKGASFVRSGKWLKMNTFSNKSVDDTGAGDAFVSGSLCGILDYKNDDTILKMGLANGSSVVSKMGAKAGLLSREEMQKMLKKKLKMVERWL